MSMTRLFHSLPKTLLAFDSPLDRLRSRPLHSWPNTLLACFRTLTSTVNILGNIKQNQKGQRLLALLLLCAQTICQLQANVLPKYHLMIWKRQTPHVRCLNVTGTSTVCLSPTRLVSYIFHKDKVPKTLFVLQQSCWPTPIQTRLLNLKCHTLCETPQHVLSLHTTSNLINLFTSRKPDEKIPNHYFIYHVGKLKCYSALLRTMRGVNKPVRLPWHHLYCQYTKQNCSINHTTITICSLTNCKCESTLTPQIK